MLEHPISAIDEAILQTLVDNHVAERRDLEFKRDLPGRSDEQVKEFLADVTSLANAQGGDLIYGIEDENGVAAGLLGVEVADHDSEILRLESSLQANVAPRLTGVRTHWVALANGRGAIIIRVPGSLTAPHRVIYRNSGRFFGRNSRGKYEMDVQELRLAFTQSEQLPQRFRQLHGDAIEAAKGVDMPFAIEASPTAVVSVAPLSLFREAHNIPITRDHALVPHRVGGFSAIDMIEGVLQHAPIDANTGTVGSFAITHRTGRTDSAFVIGGVRPGNGRELRLVWPATFEQGLRDMAISTQTRLHQFGIEGPWVVLVSVFGVKGFQMILGDGYPTKVAFRDQMLLGQHVIERIDTASLLPIAEAFWLLFGIHRPADRELGADR
jgi:hypothetical protein